MIPSRKVLNFLFPLLDMDVKRFFNHERKLERLRQRGEEWKTGKVKNA